MKEIGQKSEGKETYGSIAPDERARDRQQVCLREVQNQYEVQPAGRQWREAVRLLSWHYD